MTNPLIEEWATPFGLPPFEKIADDQFEDAFDEGLNQARSSYEMIAANPEAPDFTNTIAAMETADGTLDRVGRVFFNLAGADSNPARQALQSKLSPILAGFQADILLNPHLFARVQAVYKIRQTSGLSDEQIRVSELYHRMFVRAGANLSGQKAARYKEIMSRLATLGTSFSQNLLEDEKNWSLDLSADDIAGLPDFVVEALRGAASERGKAGWTLTLGRSVITPFLQFSPRRDLRQTAFEAWVARGAGGGATDNIANVTETLNLRYERANLLGFADFASFKLTPEMAKTPSNVRDLLMAVWEPALVKANADAQKLQSMMAADGVNGALAPWDWRYYAEKLKRVEHDIDATDIKPYLQLDQMINACFWCAERLFGLSFREIDAPLYHSDCRAWEVRRGDRHMAVFVGDYFARASKRSGAWCSSFRAQSKLDGDTRPIAVNVCNFAKPAGDEPALLSFDDARTLFHEFGHALHVCLSDVTYPFIAGTSVARDFVELPSQLFEHWLEQPEVLGKFARHKDTGEPMPADLLARLLKSSNADQGFGTVEYTASALVDLAFHEGTPPADPMARQSEVLAKLGMPDAITMRHATPQFAHVFSGDGYSSGYYSYMWSEVMDADAFAAFEEVGDIFAPEIAQRLHDNIYSAGGSRDAEELYTAFRGRIPGVEAILKKRGLSENAQD